MISHRHLHRIALAVALAIACAGHGLAACSDQESIRGAGTAEPQPTVGRKREAPVGLKASWKDPRIELAGIAPLDRSSEAELIAAARRFAISFVGWLYGRRREVDVAPITPELRTDLANAPPYVPAPQIGSGDGRAVRVQVFLQTARSGVLVVSIRDLRTRYPLPALFERRAGRWQVVRLNTH